jgi:hypothetical protein
MPFVPDLLVAYPDIRLDVSLTDVRVDLSRSRRPRPRASADLAGWQRHQIRTPSAGALGLVVDDCHQAELHLWCLPAAPDGASEGAGPFWILPNSGLASHRIGIPTGPMSRREGNPKAAEEDQSGAA